MIHTYPSSGGLKSGCCCVPNLFCFLCLTFGTCDRHDHQALTRGSYEEASCGVYDDDGWDGLVMHQE